MILQRVECVSFTVLIGNGRDTSWDGYTRIWSSGLRVHLGKGVEIICGGKTGNREPCDHHVLYARRGPSGT